MRLNEEEYYQYISIHLRCIHYIGIRKKMIPSDISFEAFAGFSASDKYPIRNAMYDNIHLLNDYIKEKSDELSEEEKDIIRDFKYFKRGTFYAMKLLKKYACFLGEQYIYGVHALSDPFESFWGGKKNLPMMVEAVLLPFKGKIVYDGFLSNYAIRFGGGMKRSLKSDYAVAEARYGIITTLPVLIDESQLQENVRSELLAMMKNKTSREYNWSRIEEILEERPELVPLYIREWGRINSRKKKKEIRELGLKKRWFAIYRDTIIQSDETEKALKLKTEQLIQDADKLNSIHYFKV